ncbi:hypothetical protein BDZ91DRAFT_718151 [Kalaharituber pfeilii]|nr:hypothetical protein BDZ91DRAFT_718151 [Kalaharituber pfeilii]
MSSKAKLLLTALVALSGHVVPSSANPTLKRGDNNDCRCAPTDPCWPSPFEWALFNFTVNGALLKSVPLGSVCHDPDYNEEKCQELRDNWIQPTLHDKSSTSMMTPYWANQSCDPFTPREQPCELGTYTQYAVKVTSIGQIRIALWFARWKNIRLVIRNTGHCFMGKSTGYGSLSIWTHHLKGMKFFDYQSNYYRGSAVKVLAGTQIGEIYEEAKKRGLMIVGGECPSVGFAGGYIQGGGHSPLSSMYGLAADNTLAFEVITAAGIFRTVTRDRDADLFWALSGGGGGTFGVVYSVTVKTFPDTSVSGAILSYSTNDTIAYYKALEYYHTLTPAWTNKGVFAYAFYNKGYFQVWPLFYPGGTPVQVSEMIAPFEAKLTELGINYKSSVTTYSNYLDAFNALFVPVTVGGFQFGGRLIPRSTVQNSTLLTGLIDAAKLIVEDGASVIDVAIRATAPVGVENSVNPAWRTAEAMFLPATAWSNDPEDWDQMLEDRKKISFVYGVALKAVTPGSGAYMNEADGDEPDWQQAFFGEYYGTLSKIKKKWDCEDVFYARNAVGSERWLLRSDGKLCKA